jgi:uncharacterized protein (TIGR02145 family)
LQSVSAGSYRYYYSYSMAQSVRCVKDAPYDYDYIFTDTRDGNIYPVKTINGTDWMMINLNYNAGAGSWCYNNESYLCGQYGRLYTWDRGLTVCPAGWHTATDDEWKKLEMHLGMTASQANSGSGFRGTDQGTKMKASGVWDGTDTVGFRGLPGGIRTSGGVFNSLGGSQGAWWTGSALDSGNAWMRLLQSVSAGSYRYYYSYSMAQSVRCVKTLEPSYTLNMTDARDGQVYPVIQIGTQKWMAKNLNYNIGNGVSSWCYNNESYLCGQYGRLYTWDRALTVCPAGWRLPSDDDWKVLEMHLGMTASQANSGSGFRGTDQGTKMKSATLFDGNNLSGFNGWPGGIRTSGGVFNSLGSQGSWWTGSAVDSGNAWMRLLQSVSTGVYKYFFSKNTAQSVRCIEN